MNSTVDIISVLNEFKIPIALGIAVLAKFITIPKLKIDIWTFLGRKLGDTINYNVVNKINEIEEKVETLENKINVHITQSEQENATTARTRILRFNDEIMQDAKHTEEHFIETLNYINDYEAYCEAHPEYPNNRAELAIENIKNTFRECQEKHTFL